MNCRKRQFIGALLLILFDCGNASPYDRFGPCVLGMAMSVVSLRYHESAPPSAQRGVIAIGNFDGAHLGHAALIREARALAKQVGGPVVPVTFDPHPLQLLAPDRYQPPLTTIARRAELLRSLGADEVVVLQTTPELLALSPEYFFETIAVGALQARGIVEGFNFRFGRDRAGSNESLRAMSEPLGIVVREVTAFELDGVIVSSSRARDAVVEGDVVLANRLLGHEYSIEGVVGTGAKRGRTIGFPTANVQGASTLLPADGVYAVRVVVPQGTFAGAANIGPNPTFGEHARKLEVHLIGFEGDLYDRSIQVFFVERLRSTQKFDSVTHLVDQMKRDVARACELCG